MITLRLGIGLAFSSGMFGLTEFCNRKPRTFGAVYLGAAALLYMLAFAIASSSSFKIHQTDFQPPHLLPYLPLGLTFLSAAWGVMAALYILLGSKLNQLNSWMRAEFDLDPLHAPLRFLRVAVAIVIAIMYGVVTFPLTFVLYRGLLHFPLVPH